MVQKAKQCFQSEGGVTFPCVPQGKLTSLACSWPGEDGQPSGSRQYAGVSESNLRTGRLRSKVFPKESSPFCVSCVVH